MQYFVIVCFCILHLFTCLSAIRIIIKTGRLKKIINYITVLSLLLLSRPLYAQQKDTLPEVKVSSIIPAIDTKRSVPAQQFKKEELSRLNSLSVADAVKYFAGTVVKDYGGIGGLKTVSVRSLGANHTGVAYDGIVMSDAQGGQIDLGKFSLDNISSITLNNSGPGIFMPARSFAYGSLLQLRTDEDRLPVRRLKYKASLKGGSFGFINPAAKINYRWSERLYTSIHAEWQKATGAYPFKSYENEEKKQKRINSDIEAYKTEAGAQYVFNDSNYISLKAYYYSAERGLPGVIILNNTSATHERLWDKNFFVQASWRKTFSAKSKLMVNAKYNYAYSHYLNPEFLSVQGKLENIFNQKELYQSATYTYSPYSFLSLAYSTDYFVNMLHRTDVFASGFPEPVRKTWLNNMAAKLDFKNLDIEANALNSSVKEKVNQGPAAKDYNKLTPAVSLSWQPLQAFPVRVRMFYKSIFRLPTFNDLYYTFIGNTNLKPEFAKQYNLGITWQQNTRGVVQQIVVTADGYINTVKDKIIAVPRQNLFQWSMQNIGKVDIKGVDVGVAVFTRQLSKTRITFRGSYTYQQAIDVTDKTSVLYKDQIPYTPQHSGSATINISYKKLSFNYNSLFSALRYITGENNPYNAVDGYSIHDLSIIYRGSFKNIEYSLTGELNNIFNKQYDVIQYYPMPGINYRAGIIINNK